MFKAAIENSPHNSCDIVLANAGITEYDPVFKFDGKSKTLLTTWPCMVSTSTSVSHGDRSLR